MIIVFHFFFRPYFSVWTALRWLQQGCGDLSLSLSPSEQHPKATTRPQPTGKDPGTSPETPQNLSLTCWPNINLQLQAGPVHRVRGGRGCGRKKGQRGWVVGTAAKPGSRHCIKIINIGRKGGIAAIIAVIVPLRMRKWDYFLYIYISKEI